MTRTWTERGRLMEQYDIRVRENGMIDSIEPVRRNLRWMHNRETTDIETEIDGAILTCQRLEREAAELAQKASRSPLAALLDRVRESHSDVLYKPCISHDAIAAAIKAQAELWRQMPRCDHDGSPWQKGYTDGYLQGVLRCVRELEGK